MQTTVLAKMTKAENQLKKRVVVLHLDLDATDEQLITLHNLKANNIALFTFGEQGKPSSKVQAKGVIKSISETNKIAVKIEFDKDMPEETWSKISRLSRDELISVTAEYCEPPEEDVAEGQMGIDDIQHDGIQYTVDSSGVATLTDAQRVEQEFLAAQEAADKTDSLPFTDDDSFGAE